MAIPIATAGGEGDDSGKRIHAVQTLILGMGRTRLGPPASEIENRIRSIHDLEQLGKLLERVLGVVSWQDLFPSE